MPNTLMEFYVWNILNTKDFTNLEFNMSNLDCKIF